MQGKTDQQYRDSVLFNVLALIGMGIALLIALV
jgi:hypothetical protein